MAHYKGENVCACAVLATHMAENNSDVKFFRWSKLDKHCVAFKHHTQGPGMKEDGRTFRLYITPTNLNDKKCMYLRHAITAQKLNTDY